MIVRLMLLLIGLVVTTASYAEILIKAKTGQTISAVIASNELTRVQVSGFPIVKAFTSDDIVIKKDATTGQLYIYPGNVKTTFNLFILDQNGDNFNLALTPSSNHLGDSIVIIPDIAAIKRATQAQVDLSSKFVNTSYSRNINQLIELMYLANGANNYGYEVNNIKQNIPLWQNLEVVLLQNYSNSALSGLVYLVTNNSKHRIVLDETQFYHKGILAVAIEAPVIESGQSSRVFIVQELLENT